MAKFIPDARLDGMLDAAAPSIGGGATIHITAGQPTGIAGGTIQGATELASATMTGTYTKSDRAGGGRQNTVPAQSDLNITADGNADHVCLTNGSDTLYQVTTCTPQALTSGGTVSTSTYNHELADPL